MLHRLIILTAKSSRILLGVNENIKRNSTKKRGACRRFRHLGKIEIEITYYENEYDNLNSALTWFYGNPQ